MDLTYVYDRLINTQWNFTSICKTVSQLESYTWDWTRDIIEPCLKHLILTYVSVHLLIYIFFICRNLLIASVIVFLATTISTAPVEGMEVAHWIKVVFIGIFEQVNNSMPSSFRERAGGDRGRGRWRGTLRRGGGYEMGGREVWGRMREWGWGGLESCVRIP